MKWLATAKKEASIPVITEIMESKYLDQMVDVADIMQIGSRNMQNYPLIMDVASTGKPIMLKRHYGASLRDWLGAAEYALVGGCKHIILCERGMSVAHTHKSSSRYMLDLQVIPAIKEMSSISVASDPISCNFLERLGCTNVTSLYFSGCRFNND